MRWRCTAPRAGCSKASAGDGTRPIEPAGCGGRGGRGARGTAATRPWRAAARADTRLSDACQGPARQANPADEPAEPGYLFREADDRHPHVIDMSRLLMTAGQGKGRYK
jgi:hypothetical protein